MLTALLFAGLAVIPRQDTVSQRAASPGPEELARAASTAAYRYESRLWRLVPTTPGGSRPDRCHEVVGRFCLWHDSPGSPPPPPPDSVPAAVEEARVVAVRAHRLWFSAAPHNTRAAGALVRFLIEDGRTREAVAAARAHAWAADRAPVSLLLLGLALHEAADFVAAEAVFDSARAAADEETRTRWDDVRVLLEPDERDRYDDLTGAAREAYLRRFWRLSDPSLLQPGNERRTGHYARHAWAAIFSEAPRVRGKVSWGSDLEELLIRYGPVSDRKRIREPGPAPMMLDRGPRYVEHFARNAVALVPASLMAEGIPGPALPGVRPEMERDSAPSSYAPVPASGGRRVLRPLDAQASWFPGRQPVLRVDAILPPDTATPALVSPRGLLAVLDTLGRVVARVEPSLSLRGDSLLLSGEVPVPSGPLVYRAEVHDDSTGTGGLIQAAVEVPRSAGLRLSDLLVAHAFGDTLPGGRDQHVQPHPSLQLPRGGPVGVYAEVHGLARRGGASYEVEWSVESAEEGSLLGRAFRWVGERLGVVEAAEPVRIRWGDVSDTGMAPIALNLDLADLDPGLYRVTLTLTDRLSGAQRTTARLIRILDGPAPPSPSPD